MRKTSVLAGIVLATFAGTVVGCDDDDDEEYSADLAVAAVSPTPTGTANATGRVEMELDDDELTVTITISGDLTSDITMAHIHAPATSTQSADIVFDFTPAMATVIASGQRTGTVLSVTYHLNDLPVTSTGVLRVDPGTLIEMMNNGLAYVNVHTTLNPSGEIRGQIIRDDDDDD